MRFNNARQFSGPGTGERDQNEYLGDTNGMVYGEDPSEGFVRGRRFLHSKLGFTFFGAAGLHPRQHRAGGARPEPGRRRGHASRRRQRPAKQSLPDYLKSGWMEHVDGTSIEEFSVNGFPAATATASGEQWSFRLFAVRFGSDVYRLFSRPRTRDAADRPQLP